MKMAAGEIDYAGLRIAFGRCLKLEFHSSNRTSDAELLTFRELDEALSLTETAGQVLADSRTGRNNLHTMAAQFRQAVFGRLAGHADVDGADRLARHPTMRRTVSGRAVTNEAASTSQVRRLATELLTGKDDLAALADLSRPWIDVLHASGPTHFAVLERGSGVRSAPDGPLTREILVGSTKERMIHAA